MTLIETWEEEIRPKDSNRKSMQSSIKVISALLEGMEVIKIRTLREF